MGKNVKTASITPTMRRMMPISARWIWMKTKWFVFSLPGWTPALTGGPETSISPREGNKKWVPPSDGTHFLWRNRKINVHCAQHGAIGAVHKDLQALHPIQRAQRLCQSAHNTLLIHGALTQFSVIAV